MLPNMTTGKCVFVCLVALAAFTAVNAWLIAELGPWMVPILFSEAVGLTAAVLLYRRSSGKCEDAEPAETQPASEEFEPKERDFSGARDFADSHLPSFGPDDDDEDEEAESEIETQLLSLPPSLPQPPARKADLRKPRKRKPKPSQRKKPNRPKPKQKRGKKGSTVRAR